MEAEQAIWVFRRGELGEEESEVEKVGERERESERISG